ncbi:hypothetical protein [uncultured Sphingomonas sp.]|uniref:hypothetical protein n=1 Tax=uncultured Sphingomonas sp. TaxID=158754 RepID=UPI002601483C|nr:hypothetical protein [uncultured Sphingomonas sp.]
MKRMDSLSQRLSKAIVTSAAVPAMVSGAPAMAQAPGGMGMAQAPITISIKIVATPQQDAQQLAELVGDEVAKALRGGTGTAPRTSGHMGDTPDWEN